MQWRFNWNPITIKRWRRFHDMKRAWWSFRILILLYSLSLVAELLCGNTPLYVRYDGRSYFPLLHFYPESTFLPGGRHTRPDYKLLRQSPSFTRQSGNLILFPPIPYGPNEIIDPSSISLPGALELTFLPQPRVGSVNIRRDWTAETSLNAGQFFNRPDADVRGLVLTNFWIIPPSLIEALDARFRNTSALSLSAPCQPRNESGSGTDISLSDFSPRSSPPSTIRLTLRERLPAGTSPGTVSFNNRLEPTHTNFHAWASMDSPTRTQLIALAARRLNQPAEKETIRINGAPYDVRADRAEVRWPFQPVPGHWLGIDTAGRDVLARILYGLRTSMTFGLLLVLLSMTLGTILGAIQGYFGGTTDILGQRLTEIWNALPFLYVMILLGAVYGRSFLLLLFCYAIFNWIGISYYVRAEFLRLRHLPFVEAARTTGLPHRKIIFRHILPNALTPLITFFPFQLVGAIGALAALDYLGFGLPPPTSSWGELLQQAHQFRWAWWLILYPSLALFSVMLLGVFIGEGIRNAYDPRRHSHYE
jgi:microcin C transport system permease protein